MEKSQARLFGSFSSRKWHFPLIRHLSDWFPEKLSIYELPSLGTANPHLEGFPVKGVTLRLEIMLKSRRVLLFHTTENCQEELWLFWETEASTHLSEVRPQRCLIPEEGQPAPESQRAPCLLWAQDKS